MANTTKLAFLSGFLVFALGPAAVTIAAVSGEKTNLFLLGLGNFASSLATIALLASWVLVPVVWAKKLVWPFLGLFIVFGPLKIFAFHMNLWAGVTDSLELLLVLDSLGIAIVTPLAVLLVRRFELFFSSTARIFVVTGSILISMSTTSILTSMLVSSFQRGERLLPVTDPDLAQLLEALMISLSSVLWLIVLAFVLALSIRTYRFFVLKYASVPKENWGEKDVVKAKLISVRVAAFSVALAFPALVVGLGTLLTGIPYTLVLGGVIRPSSSDIAAILAVLIALLTLLFVWLPSLVAGRAVAKGKSWLAFFWLSLLVTPLLMWIIVEASGAARSESQSTKEEPKATKNEDVSQPLSQGETRMCPMCAEEIKIAAKLCKHCGSTVEPVEV